MQCFQQHENAPPEMRQRPATTEQDTNNWEPNTSVANVKIAGTPTTDTLSCLMGREVLFADAPWGTMTKATDVAEV